MNRDYIDWLESLPCNQHRQRRKVNEWMSEWAQLPTEIDLPRYEEWQQELNQRDCRDGVMSRLWRWAKARVEPRSNSCCRISSGNICRLAGLSFLLALTL